MLGSPMTHNDLIRERARECWLAIFHGESDECFCGRHGAEMIATVIAHLKTRSAEPKEQ